MKLISKITLITFILLINITPKMINAQEKSAKDVIIEADKLMQGESYKGEMTMKIIRPKWEREVKFKTWTKDRDYSLTLITYPAKEKDQTFLKRKQEMWIWNPTINRMIKLPPSMMSQGWMGSDYSNDDILKESSMIVDYNHSFDSTEIIDGRECWKIIMIPKDDASVVWGKLIKWVSKEGYFQLKTEYYDEENYLIKTENSSQIKFMHNREIPTYIEIIPEDEPGNMTIIIIETAEFNIDMPDNFFSQQNMKRIRK